MYDFRPNTVFGFHGCDLEVRNTLVNHPNKVIISNKPYDWLGHGMYFWENNYERAVEWAESKSRTAMHAFSIQLEAYSPKVALPIKELDFLRKATSKSASAI